MLFQHNGDNGSLYGTVIWFIEAKNADSFIVTWKLLWQDRKWWMQTVWILNTCRYSWCTVSCRNIHLTGACTARFMCRGAGRRLDMCHLQLGWSVWHLCGGQSAAGTGFIYLFIYFLFYLCIAFPPPPAVSFHWCDIVLFMYSSTADILYSRNLQITLIWIEVNAL
jgi:hypothetical protein